MPNTSSQPDATERRFAERYPKYSQPKKIRDDELGELYRAQNVDNQRSVWVLDLYAWVGDLPQNLQDRLCRALLELKQLAQPALLAVIDYQVEPTKLIGDQPSRFNYIEFAWQEGITLDRWPQLRLKDPLTDAAALVVQLAKTMTALQQAAAKQQIGWIRPVLKPEKILLLGPEDSFAEDRLPTTVNPVLTDAGLAVLLTDLSSTPKRLPKDDEDEVKALGRLFLQLLSAPDYFRVNLSSKQEIDRVVGEVQKLHPQLQNFFYRVFAPSLPDGYRNAGEVADALTPFARGLLVPTQQAENTRSLQPQSPAPSGQPPQASRAGQQQAGQSAAQTDELIVEYINPKPNEQTRREKLRRDAPFTLGNGSDDDVRLPGLSTPRRLVILHQNGQHTERYVITDTGNGSLAQAAHLDGMPLSPYFAALFYENSQVELDGYRLSLRQTRLTTSQIISRQRRPFQVPQTRYVGNPGDMLQIQVALQNTTSEVDSFWIAVDGAPEAMQFELPETQELYENETSNITIMVRLPVLTLSLAGDYRLILRLISENYRVQIAALQVIVTVLPHYDFAGALLPETLRVGDDGELVIENHGNLARNFVVQWRDRGQDLDFVPPDATITVPSRAAVSTNYRTYIRGGKWRWLGGKQFHPMSVLVSPQKGGVPQTLTGQVISRALIPSWVLTVVLLLLLLFLLAATFLFQPEFAHSATVRGEFKPETTMTVTWIAVPTPIAGTPFTLRWNPLGSCFYSVYENGVISEGPKVRWDTNQALYEVKNLSAGTVVEVRLRSCLLIRERAWQVAIAPPPVVTPTPTPTVLPAIAVATADVKYREQQALLSRPITPTPVDGVIRLLVGQTGDFCLTWQVTGVYERLSITPTLNLALPDPAGEQCLPVVELFKGEKVATDYRLTATRGDAVVTSAPFARVQVSYPICRVNIDASVGGYLTIREGPGRNFAERGNLLFGQKVMVLSRPFKPVEQNDSLEWILVAVENDPRPGWVAYREQTSGPGEPPKFNEYLACPDISVMPDANAIPPTPTTTPTVTSEPTATPTATPASDISLEPAIINPGGCAKLKWKIENVKEVYINDVGVIGEGERDECPPASGQYTYEWRIVKTDGSLMKVTKILTVNPGAAGTPAPPTPPG